ncbi:MAG TPA: hypothetical protein VMF11_02555 [Candidatus Baltobacteraceae bacterium]|nr:hypothetical protein [Candidatus Baltobacteraceae bacterium]
MRTIGARARESMGAAAANCQRYNVPLSLEAIFFSAVETWDPSREILREAQLAEIFVRLKAVTRPDAPNEISPWFEAISRDDFPTPYISLKDVIVSLALRIGERLDTLLVETGLDVAALLRHVEETAGNIVDGPIPVEPPSPLRYAVVISGPGFDHAGNRYERREQAEAAKRHFEALLHGANPIVPRPTASFGFHLPPNFYQATQITIRELG